MKPALLVVFVLIFVLIVTPPEAKELRVEYVPKWVHHNIPLTLAAAPRDDLRNGVYYRHHERQIKVDDDGLHRYFRFRVDAINNSGLNKASQINIEYDPVYEQVYFHHLKVVRSGHVIDKLKTAAVAFLQREKELEKNIYNGTETLNIVLDDVRINDSIEYAYSIIGQNPVYDQLYASTQSLQWRVPVGTSYLRLLWNKKSRLDSKLLNGDESLNLSHLAIKDTAMGKEYVLRQNNVKPLTVPDDSPDWYSPYKVLQFSEYRDWPMVKRWATRLFEASADDQASTVKAIAASIMKDSRDDSERIAKALQYTQSAIRYYGIEFGENSHRPSMASQTIERRFGDCKDKTVVLVTLLKLMGIDAAPALVNTQSGTDIEKYLPSSRLFDHVIVRVHWQGRDYWLDPTLDTQFGSLDQLYQPEYGVALVLDGSSLPLQKTNSANNTFTYSINERFQLPEQAADPVLFDVQSTFHGDAASRERSFIESKGYKQLQEDYVRFYSSYFPGIEMRDMLQVEGEKSARLLVREQYRIDNFWTKSEDGTEQTAYFYPASLLQYLKKPVETKREHPYALSYPLDILHKTTIDFNSSDWQFDDAHFTEDNAYFFFQRTVNYDSEAEQLNLYYRYISKRDHVPAREFTQYIAALEKLEQYKDFGIVSYLQDAASDDEGPDVLEGIALDWELEQWIVCIWLVVFLMLLIVTLGTELLKGKKGSHEKYGPSLTVFSLYYVATLGLYSFIWFYQQWSEVKRREGAAIMPFFRSIVSSFWYYPLYERLYARVTVRDFLPSRLYILACSVVSLILSVVYMFYVESYVSIYFFILLLLMLPLVNAVNYMSVKNTDSHPMTASQWLLTVFVLPIMVIIVVIDMEMALFSRVIPGEQLAQEDLKFLQRHGIVSPGQKVSWLYSDDWFSLMNDGNGMTQEHVFSYWKEDGVLFKYSAQFDQIARIEVTQDVDSLQESIINVHKKDGVSFILYFPSDHSGDDLYIEMLMSQWERSKMMLQSSS